MEISESIQYYRNLAGLTQVQLAEQMDIKQYNLAKYESGSLKIPNSIIPKLAQSLGITIDTLFGEKPKDISKALPKKSSRAGQMLEVFEKLTINDQRSLLKQAKALAKE